MITLITGAIGSGKTALLVSMLMESDETKNRRIFVDGVADLVLPHEVTPPLADWTKTISVNDIPEIIFTFPEGSLIIIDEIQRLFRPRATGSRVPDAVQAFEKHRHLGLDFWMTSQHPNLLDPNIRRFVGRHIHIRNTFMGRFTYEFTECGDVESASARQLSAKRKYRLPKSAFDKYKSASIHTKLKKRVPLYVYAFVLAIFGMIGSAWYIKNAISSKLAPASASVGALVNGPHQAGSANSQALLVIEAINEAQKDQPKKAGLVFTAPRYADITKPDDAPFPVACIASKTRCSCSSQQATPLDVPDKLCREIVAGGIFRDWHPRERQELSRVASVHPSPALPAMDIDSTKKYIQIDPPEPLRTSPGFGAAGSYKDGLKAPGGVPGASGSTSNAPG